MHVALYSFQSFSSIPFFVSFQRAVWQWHWPCEAGSPGHTHNGKGPTHPDKFRKLLRGPGLKRHFVGPASWFLSIGVMIWGSVLPNVRRDSPFSRETRFVSRIRRKIADWEITWKGNGSSMTISKDRIF